MRRPFRNRRLFIEVPLLDEKRLRELAEHCGLDLPASLLDWYIANGYLLPIRRDGRRPQFARWQLWTLMELEDARQSAVRVSDYVSLDGQDGRSWRKQLESAVLMTRGKWFQHWLELVILLQNGYAPSARGSRGWAIGRFPSDTTPDGRYLRGTYRRRIAGPRPLREVGLSRRAALDLRRTAGLRLDSIDPLAEWYPLLRFASKEQREALRGVPRLVQELHVGDRILELYLEQLTGRTQPDPGDLHADPRVDYVKRHYGRSKDYADPHFLEVVLAEYGLDTVPRAVVFVEGHTEQRLLPLLARECFGHDLHQLGIEVRDLHGVGNAARAIDLIRYISEPRISGRVRLERKRYAWLRGPLTHAYLVCDREGPFSGPLRGPERGKLISEFRRLKTRQFLMLFNPDFERANFSSRELATAISRQLRRSVRVADVAAWRNQRGSRKQELSKWLRDTYGKTIKKTDLVPFYVRLLRPEVAGSDGVHFRRPVLSIVSRILRIRFRQEAIRDARLRRYVTGVP